jgi:hypothetical protein
VDIRRTIVGTGRTMTDAQFPAVDTVRTEADEAEAAERFLDTQPRELPVEGPVDEAEEAEQVVRARAVIDPADLEIPPEADPADAMEQAVPVPVDEDEYR